MPMSVRPRSQRVTSGAEKYSRSLAIRSISKGWRSRACDGIMTFLAGSSWKPRGAASWRGPTRTRLRVCDSRVVLRTTTGVSKRSLSSKARRV